MKLTPTQSRILAHTLLDSSVPIQEVARATQVKAHTARYTINRLQQQGAIEPFVLLNPHVLGLTDFCIFFNCQGEERQIRKKIIAFCVKSPHTAYVAELSGTYAYSVSIFARSIFEVEAFFADLSLMLPRASFSLSFAIRCSWSIFSPQFLDQKTPRSKTRVVTRTAGKLAKPLDSQDFSILQFLAKEPGLSNFALGKKLGMHEATIRARLRKLREQQVILSTPYHIVGDDIGLKSFRAVIVSKGSSMVLEKQIQKFALQNIYVSELVRCMGSWNFEVNFLAPFSIKPSEILEEIQDELGAYIHSVHILDEVAVHKTHHFPESAALPG